MYETVDEMQKNLDVYLDFYNTQRSHQGRKMNGRTLMDVFLNGIKQLETIA